MDPVIVAIVAAVLGPLGAYLVAARRFSGKIQTSDATDLWAEARSIRDWSTTRIETQNQTIDGLETRVTVLESSNSRLLNSNTELTAKNENLADQVHDLSETIVDLRSEIKTLTQKLDASRSRVAELEEPSA